MFLLCGSLIFNSRSLDASIQNVLFTDCRSVEEAKECIRAVLPETPEDGGVHGWLCDELLATSLKLAVLLCIGDVATPQLVAMESKIPFMITHSPSHMFVTDRLGEEPAFI